MEQFRIAFIREIEAFLARAKMSESRLGTEALGNPSFVYRFRAGAGLTDTTIDRLREFMERHPE